MFTLKNNFQKFSTLLPYLKQAIYYQKEKEVIIKLGDDTVILILE